MSSVDYRAWEKKFNGQARIVIESDLKTLHEACDVLFHNIVNRTPVGNPNLWEPPYWPQGYSPGHLKANWKIEHQDNVVIISNDAPYAYAIETGHSRKQAPMGMMRVSLKEFDAILKKVKSKYTK